MFNPEAREPSEEREISPKEERPDLFAEKNPNVQRALEKHIKNMRSDEVSPIPSITRIIAGVDNLIKFYEDMAERTSPQELVDSSALSARGENASLTIGENLEALHLARRFFDERR